MEWRGRGVMDPVLHRIFTMGLFDWSAPNDHLNQTTLAMCYMTVMGMKLFQQIHENDLKVLLLSVFIDLTEIDEAYSVISLRRICARQARREMPNSTRSMKTWLRWITNSIAIVVTLTTRKRQSNHCTNDRNNSRRKWIV